ncbi:protein-export chaperone SecB [bacterium]|nr:protein-export chaperone SecB [bacterium]
MSDMPTPVPPSDPQAGSTPEGERKAPMIRVLAQFAKDLSFENPAPLSNLGAQGSPNIELGIDVKADPGPEGDNLYAVELRLAAQAKREENVVFIIELVYAGVFELVDAEPRDVKPMLLIECPRLLFPFARRVIAEVTREGGFPPLLIDPIDFVGLYRQQEARAQAEAAAGTSGAPPAS